MKRELVLPGAMGEELILTSWTHATPFQRHCAVDPHWAGHLLGHALSINRDLLEHHRSHILSLTGLLGPLGAHRTGQADLRQLVLDNLREHGRLILVDEGLHLPPCGVGHKPDSLDASGGSTSGSKWAGDTSKWTQEKKLESMHPALRPLVKGVIAGLSKRGFQPIVFYGWRSITKQLEIVKKGNSKVKFSFHNIQKKDGTPDAYAADIIDKRWAWSKAAAQHGYWKALGEEAKKQSLYWGGDWKKPDWAHVQLVPNSQLKRFKKESGL